MEELLEINGFDVDGDVEMTMIQTQVIIQKHDLGGGGMPGEFDGMAAIEAFKELCERVEIIRRNMSIKCSQRLGFSRAE